MYKVIARSHSTGFIARTVTTLDKAIEIVDEVLEGIDSETLHDLKDAMTNEGTWYEAFGSRSVNVFKI